MSKVSRIQIIGIALILGVQACNLPSATNRSPTKIVQPPEPKVTLRQSVIDTPTFVPQRTDTSSIITLATQSDIPRTTPIPLSTDILAESSFCLHKYGSGQFVAKFHEDNGAVSHLVVGDFNSDGLPDLFVPRMIFESPQSFNPDILINNGKGGFDVGIADLFTGPPPLIMQTAKVILDDFNGDSKVDIYVADSGQHIIPGPGYQNTLILSTSDGKLIDATGNLPYQSDSTHSATSADIDGDGDVDIYVGNIWGEKNIGPYILVNTGNGIFEIGSGLLPHDQRDLSKGTYPASLFVDVNQDEIPDLILGGGGLTPSEVLINDGAGHFSILPNALPQKPMTSTDIALDIKPIDINRDEFVDILVVFTQDDPWYQGWYIQGLINNGDGTFVDDSESRIPHGKDALHFMSELELLDLDGDGDLDLVGKIIAMRVPPIFLLDDGKGIYSPAPAAFPATIDHPWLFTFLDVDLDSSLELISLQFDGLFLYQENGCLVE